jgi:hypothetical protein
MFTIYNLGLSTSAGYDIDIVIFKTSPSTFGPFVLSVKDSGMLNEGLAIIVRKYF